MDHDRLLELSAVVLKEVKTLLKMGDPSAFLLTDPIFESGSPSAQTFGDNRAGDSDYELWIRLLRLHSSAQSLVDRRPGALADLKERIVEFERSLPTGASLGDGGGDVSGYATSD
jgi:hypothetical protein